MTRAVLFVLLETALHEGGLLIIRRPWVRVPPAPPAVIRYIRCLLWTVSWTDAGEAIALVVVA
jgi:hypothetical protein